MAEVARITGVEQAMKDLAQFPINADKVVEKAMRKGGSAVAKRIRAGVKKSFRKAVKSKLYNKGEGSYVLVGLFKGRESHDAEKGAIPAFFKAYWQNYGTLSRRDPSHQFEYPRKGRSAKFKGGIKPRGWFEGTAATAQSEFVPAMQREYSAQLEKLYSHAEK